ncbi:MAG: alcohol dehydrogenase catalytic domain-containing protein [Burkholderiaceae bacterium]
MLAVIAREIGPADQVVDCVSQAEPPAPAQGEVLLEMLAMSINPADLLMIEGRYGVAAEPPFTPGFEGIGQVLACGDGVDDIAPGDLVLPGGGGCWRERLVRRRDALVKLPPDVDPIQAAMLRANPATAWAMLESIPGLEPGEWVAQNAANSAVGGYVHQLARRRGVHVLAIVRREAAAAAARASGAHAVLVDDGSLSLADLARQAAP